MACSGKASGESLRLMTNPLSGQGTQQMYPLPPLYHRLRDVLTVSIYDMQQRGFDSIAGPAYNDSLADTPCITCGQCILVCPTAALHEKDDTDKV